MGRFERISEDWSILQSKFDFPDLGHAHKSEHDHYSKYYTRTSKRLIAEHYSEDIECFDYEFIEA